MGLGSLVPLISGVGGASIGFWGVTMVRDGLRGAAKWFVLAGVVAGFTPVVLLIVSWLMDTLGII